MFGILLAIAILLVATASFGPAGGLRKRRTSPRSPRAPQGDTALGPPLA